MSSDNRDKIDRAIAPPPSQRASETITGSSEQPSRSPDSPRGDSPSLPPTPPVGQPGTLDLEDDELRALLGAALQPPPVTDSDMLAGVQERIRTRSKGKFFNDGWSTQVGSHWGYLATSLLMLALLLAMYLALTPGGLAAP